MNKFTIILLVVTAFTTSCKKETVDYIISAKKIYTVNNNFDTANCIAVKDGKIYDIGNFDEISKKYSAKETLNFDENYVYPGFIDAHCHFYGYGLSLQWADLNNTKSFDEILEIISEHYKKNKTKWITGRGWDQNKWKNKKFPDNSKLNELFPDVPVLLTRVDGHAVLVNNKALELAGFNTDSKIEGGLIEVKNNKLTGILLDKAADSLKNLIPVPVLENKIKYILQAQKKCFAVGLTTVSDAGLEKEIVELIDSLNSKGLLKIRIYAMLLPTKENIEKYVNHGIYKTDFLNVRSLKLFSDGALGSRGACMLKPYNDDPENYGIIVTSPDSIRKICKIAIENNYQVSTHAIGDSANRTVLKIYSEFLKKPNDKRWRIEHSQVINENDFELFNKFSIIPSVQSTHATSDMYWAEDRIGKERIKGAYAYKRLMEQNGWIPNGSDFPVESINPVYGFYAYTSRKDFNNFPENGFQMQNALTRKQALKAMTIWAAKSNFEENEKGSLEKGKFADFVILNKDLMKDSISEIYKAKVIKTFVQGKVVYSK